MNHSTTPHSRTGIVRDISLSMANDGKWDQAYAATTRFVRDRSPDQHVAIVDFAAEAHPFTPGFVRPAVATDLLTEVHGDFGSATNIGAALRAATDLFTAAPADDALSVVLLYSDGMHNALRDYSYAQVLREAELLKRKSLVVSIAFGFEGDDMLENIASPKCFFRCGVESSKLEELYARIGHLVDQAGDQDDLDNLMGLIDPNDYK